MDKLNMPFCELTEAPLVADIIALGSARASRPDSLQAYVTKFLEDRQTVLDMFRGLAL